MHIPDEDNIIMNMLDEDLRWIYVRWIYVYEYVDGSNIVWIC